MKRKQLQKKPQFFLTRAAWRSWLKKNHGRDVGVWVLFYKKHVGRGLTYEEAVEEALCFGWIDGQLRRIDEKQHILWFCPRRPGSVWAPSNIARVQRLIREKKMAANGLAVFRSAKLQKRTAPSAVSQARIVLPPELRRALITNRKAWMHFQNYPKSFRRTAIFWVLDAKHGETRTRRIRDIVANAAKNLRPKY